MQFVTWFFLIEQHYNSYVVNSSSYLCQIEEGTVLKVAGGLIIEHPLILPLVKKVVSLFISICAIMVIRLEGLLD